MKGETKLSVSHSHLKAGILTVSMTFISPGEWFPGANFNILNGATFSLFHSKSHRSHELQMQPYLHLDICSQRDFSSFLWSDQENVGGITTTLSEPALLNSEVADKLLHGKGWFCL